MLKLIFIFIFFSLYGFSQDTIKEDVFRIDPSNARGGAASQIFDKIYYIPLETTKESIFNRIDQLEVTKDYYIILDDIGNSILIFNKNGKFHCKIDEIPGVKNKYPSYLFNSFSVDRCTNEIIVTSNIPHIRSTLFYFDLNGHFLRSIPVLKKPFSEFMSMGKNKIVFYQSAPSNPDEITKKEAFNLFFVQNNKKILAKALSYSSDYYLPSSDRISAGNSFYTSGKIGIGFFTNFYDYKLYELDSAGLKHVYKLIFPLAHSLPGDFISNKSYDKKRIDFLNRNPSVIYGLSNIYKLKNYLLFRTASISNGDNFKDFDLIYDTKTGRLFSYYRLLPDTLSCFLPVYNPFTGFQACDGEYFYTSLSSLDLFNMHYQTQKKHIKYSAILENYFKTQSRKSNPVIVQLKLKPNL